MDYKFFLEVILFTITFILTIKLLKCFFKIPSEIINSRRDDRMHTKDELYLKGIDFYDHSNICMSHYTKEVQKVEVDDNFLKIDIPSLTSPYLYILKNHCEFIIIKINDKELKFNFELVILTREQVMVYLDELKQKNKDILLDNKEHKYYLEKDKK